MRRLIRVVSLLSSRRNGSTRRRRGSMADRDERPVSLLRKLPQIRPVVGADADALVLEVEALYAGKGPPPRKTLTVHAPDGSGPRIRLAGLFIECAVCGTRQPQSRSRQSPEARQLWVRMHLRCTQEEPR
jgi:hypothetical protein